MCSLSECLLAFFAVSPQAKHRLPFLAGLPLSLRRSVCIAVVQKCLSSRCPAGENRAVFPFLPSPSKLTLLFTECSERRRSRRTRFHRKATLRLSTAAKSTSNIDDLSSSLSPFSLSSPRFPPQLPDGLSTRVELDDGPLRPPHHRRLRGQARRGGRAGRGRAGPLLGQTARAGQGGRREEQDQSAPYVLSSTRCQSRPHRAKRRETTSKRRRHNQNWRRRARSGH